METKKKNSKYWRQQFQLAICAIYRSFTFGLYTLFIAFYFVNWRTLYSEIYHKFIFLLWLLSYYYYSQQMKFRRTRSGKKDSGLSLRVSFETRTRSVWCSIWVWRKVSERSRRGCRKGGSGPSGPSSSSSETRTTSKPNGKCNENALRFVVVSLVLPFLFFNPFYFILFYSTIVLVWLLLPLFGFFSAYAIWASFAGLIILFYHLIIRNIVGMNASVFIWRHRPRQTIT